MKTIVISLAVIGAGAVATSCSNDFTSCVDTRTCAPEPGAEAGTSGKASGGEEAGTSNQGGLGGQTNGQGGAPGLGGAGGDADDGRAGMDGASGSSGANTTGSGGVPNTNGASRLGGLWSAGRALGSGGLSSTGGSSGTAGASAFGGTSGAGGSSGKGGTAGTGGLPGGGGKGGTSGAGGLSGTAGTAGAGGSSGKGGTAGIGGSSGAPPTNPCSPNPCAHGTCQAQGQSFTCSCTTGYSGNLCQTNVNDCAPNPCLNGGTCTDGIAAFSCACANGFAGNVCQTNINDCASNPCQHGGVCTDGIASHSCDCTGKGYTGTNCEIPRFQPLPFIASSVGFLGVDISGDGLVIIGYGGNTVFASYRLRSGGVPEDLTVALGPGAIASAVNQDGTVMAGADATGAFRATLGGSAVQKTNFGVPAGYASCGANFAHLSADGSTVGLQCVTGANQYSGFAWTTKQDGSSTSSALPAPAGTTLSEASSVNGDGSVVVGRYSGSGSTHAVAWNLLPGATITMTDLGALTATGSPLASAVSADGKVVAGFESPNAFRWTAASGIRILPRPPGILTGNVIPSDASADGSVIVGFFFGNPQSGAPTDAVVWIAGVVHNLVDLLLSAGVLAADLDGWLLGNATGVSADGKVVVGIGTNPGGQLEGWAARLP